MANIVLSAPIAVDVDLAHVVERARDYAADALAPNTRRAYAADWKQFDAWCRSVRLPSMPAAPVTVATYLAHLASVGSRPSSIERALAGIAHAHGAANAPWERGASIVRDVLAGIRRRHGVAPQKRSPLRGAELQTIVGALGHGLRDVRNRALLTLGWFCASRRSEIVGLDVHRVAFVPEGLVIHLERSKTDQTGRGTKKGVPFAGDPSVCPVRALRAWLDASGIVEGPIFRSIDKASRIGTSRLSSGDVARIVKEVAERAGLDPSTLAGHSLRSGFMTTAARRKKSLDAIMRQSGHRSVPVALEYIDDASLFDDNAAAGLL